jgi:hypothetical protein
MKILTTSAETQTLSFIPRSYPASGTLILRDDSTNVVLTSSETLTKVGEYLTISKVFSLVEGRYYDLKVVSNGLDIYRDKIFCTDQVINQDSNFYYSVNAGMEDNLSERVSLADGVFEDNACLDDVLKEVDGREYIKENSRDNDYIII